MKKFRVSVGTGHYERTISEFVSDKLRNDDDEIQPKNGIEDRLRRTEEYLGWLTNIFVEKGILSAEEVKKQLAFWSHHHNVEVIDVQDN